MLIKKSNRTLILPLISIILVIFFQDCSNVEQFSTKSEALQNSSAFSVDIPRDSDSVPSSRSSAQDELANGLVYKKSTNCLKPQYADTSKEFDVIEFSGLNCYSNSESCDDDLKQLMQYQVPPVVKDFTVISKYIDSKSSVVDPIRLAIQNKQFNAIRRFIIPVEYLADYFVSNPVIYQAQGNKAIGWLKSWAQGNAMSGVMNNDQAYYARKWFLAEVAIAYIKVQKIIPEETNQIIVGWLSRLAKLVYDHQGYVMSCGTYVNNHLYWEALGVTLVGKIIKNQDYINFGISVFNLFETQLQEDNFLPEELGRASYAFHYHIFAASPLVILEFLFKRNSVRLQGLVSRIAATYNDRSLLNDFAKAAYDYDRDNKKEIATDYTQNVDSIDKQITFMVIYNYSHSDMPDVQKVVSKVGDLSYVELGGNPTNTLKVLTEFIK